MRKCTNTTSINIFLIRGCCTGNDYIYFSQVILFYIKKKNSIVKMWWTNNAYFLMTYLETKTVSFLNKNKQTSALFYTIINYQQVWMSINVLYANISGISVQFLFIGDHENKRCTEQCCRRYTQKLVLYVRLISLRIMVNRILPCHTTFGTSWDLYAHNLIVCENICVCL